MPGARSLALAVVWAAGLSLPSLATTLVDHGHGTLVDHGHGAARANYVRGTGDRRSVSMTCAFVAAIGAPLLVGTGCVKM